MIEHWRTKTVVCLSTAVSALINKKIDLIDEFHVNLTHKIISKGNVYIREQMCTCEHRLVPLKFMLLFKVKFVRNKNEESKLPI